jgi:hypothetical protein
MVHVGNHGLAVKGHRDRPPHTGIRVGRQSDVERQELGPEQLAAMESVCAQRSDRMQRIVEIGDGEVSDIVGWTTERFSSVLAERFSGR